MIRLYAAWLAFGITWWGFVTMPKTMVEVVKEKEDERT